MARQLRFVAWNTDGVSARRTELATSLVDYDADVVLLSETRLAPNRRFSLPAYTWHRKDRNCPEPRATGGGVAILVHRRVSHRGFPPPGTTQNETCAVALDVYTLELRVISAYLWLSRRTPPQEEWDALLDSALPTIIAGDLNSHHPTWNSRTSNPYFNFLRRAVEDDASVLVIGPSETTHFARTSLT